MRGKLSDQDLTDYALNELGPEERLYVESMLAVSEECREDVYKTIDLGLLIEEAFERDEAHKVTVELTEEQRLKLLDVHVPNRFLRRSVALLAAAAAVTLAFVSKDVWLPKSAAVRVAQVSNSAQQFQQMVSAEGEDFVSQLASFRKLTEEPSKWLPSQPSSGAAVFGPPASLFNVEISPRGGLEFSQ